MGKWFSGLRVRMLLMTFFPFLVAVAAAVFCARSFSTVISEVRDIVSLRMPVIKALEHISKGQSKVSLNIAGGLNAINEPEELKKHFAEIREGLDEVKSNMKKYEAIPQNEKEKAVWKEFASIMPKWEESVGQATGLISEGKAAEAAAYLDGTQEAIQDQAVQAIEKILAIAYEEADSEGDLVLAVSNSARWSSMLFSLIGGGLAFIVGLAIAARTASRLDQVAERLKKAGSEVAQSSEQLNAASQQVSSGSARGAASLEETVASLEELSSIVTQNAQAAQGASSLAGDSFQAAERGTSQTNELLSVMKQIEQSSKKIEEIISVIDDIAFQTNLLALNAAVEAARAGEQGKGFAVVAEAVRNLSQRTSAAARDITNLIQTSVRDVASGGKAAESTGDALKAIFESVKKMSALNSEIASSSNEQAKGIGQINKAMNELDSSTQQNAAVAEEVSASSGALQDQANELSRLVFELEDVVSGSSAKKQAAGFQNESMMDDPAQWRAS